MKFTKKDLLESLKLKIGDRIVVHFKYSPREYLTVREDLMLEFDNGNTDSLISLVDLNYEKVDIKLFEPVPYETAIRRMGNGKETYIKYKGRYLKCILTRSLNDSKEKAIILMYDNCTMETIMDIAEALDYKFYLLM